MSPRFSNVDRGLSIAGPGRPSRPRFEHLRLLPLSHDPAVELTPTGVDRRGIPRHGFETVEACIREDLYRSTHLRLSGLPGAEELAHRLNESAPDFAHDSLASRRYAREMRRVDTSNLLALIDQHPIAGLRTFTLVKPAWATDAEQLAEVSAQSFTSQFRRQLGRIYRGAPGEFLFGQVHGEFDSRTKTFQIHLHGLCAAAYKQPLEAVAAGLATSGVAKPLRFRDVVQGDAARQITYLTQSFWPHRPTILIDGVPRRTRAKSRIPEPFGSAVLLWLDQQSIGTVQVKLGLVNSTYGMRSRN